MIEIRNEKGAVISRCRNQSALRRKVGKDAVRWVAIDENVNNGEGRLMMLFENGDKVEFGWASFNVLRMSLRNWRNLYGAKLLINHQEVGVVSKDNSKLIEPSIHDRLSK